MKTNGTRILLIVVFVQLLILILSFSTKAQPDYIFRGAVLVSGTDLQPGAQYRFSNVKPGVDGMLTILGMTEDMTLKELDGPSGFDEAFQPYINCAPKKNGHVDFLLEFVITGTTIPMVQLEVPLTAIDIDGYEFPDDKLFETDGFEESASYFIDYDMLGTSLEVKKSSNWFEAINKSAITYDGIDTIQHDVMFSMVHAGVSSVRFRVGADNRSANSMTRLRSVYFKKFIYANSFLSKSALLSFSGYEKNNKVNLNWKLAEDHTFSKIEIQKAVSVNKFELAREISITASHTNQYLFDFTDNAPLQGNAYYRLKLISSNGTVTYSNILAFRNNSDRSNSFKIYPSSIQTNATISVVTSKAGTAVLQLIDYGGRIIHKQQITINEGSNNVQLNSMANVTGGNYLAVLRMDNNTYTQKIIKQ
jgi:hypothetical protein